MRLATYYGYCIDDYRYFFIIFYGTNVMNR